MTNKTWIEKEIEKCNELLADNNLKSIERRGINIYLQSLIKQIDDKLEIITQ